MTAADIPPVAAAIGQWVEPAHRIAVPGRPDVVLACNDRDVAERVASLLGGGDCG